VNEAARAVLAEQDRQMLVVKSHAWSVAALQRAKRMPSLERWLKPPAPPRKLDGDELAGAQADHEELSAALAPEGAS
jgi:hypothetical protein